MADPLERPADHGRVVASNEGEEPEPRSGPHSASQRSHTQGSTAKTIDPRPYDYCLVRAWDTHDRRHRGPTQPSAATGKLRAPSPGARATARRRRRHLARQRHETQGATPWCRCHADPTQPHGPDCQRTPKLNGEAVTRRLNAEEAVLCKEWIDKDRRTHRLIAQVRRVETRAGESRLTEAIEG